MSLIQRLIGRHSNKSDLSKQSQKIIKDLSPDQFAELLSQIDCVRVQDMPSRTKEQNHQTRQQMMKNYYRSELNHKRRAGPAGNHNDIIMSLIVQYYSKEITAQLSSHVITFSNGSEIWVANKYYSYGTLYRHEHIYNSDEYVTDDVFLEVLHLENTLKSPLFAIENLPRLV